MSTRARGCLVFLGIIFVAVVFCAWIPFVVMPGAGVGVALPVIEVPGEVVAEGGFFGLNLTNTIIGTIVADILVLLFAFLVWRASNGWTREVPGRLQGWAEFFLGGFYNFMRGIGGDRLRTAPYLWPLVATIFIFLLAANWMKLLPGVETVGKMHCAYEGQSGYAMMPGWTEGSYRLHVFTPLNAGTTQTAETYALCNNFFKYKEFGRFALDDEATIETALADAEVALADANTEYNNLVASLPADATTWSDEQVAEVDAAKKAVETAERGVERQTLRLENAQMLPELEVQLASLEAQLNEPAAEDHAEGEIVTVAETRPVTQSQVDAVRAARDAALTQIQYPTATLVLPAEQLDAGAVPFIFHITPFVRGPATDLSLTFALAIMSIVLVQAYGVWALGPAYFEKFVNISALGNLGKKPLGAIDFIVGLIEIISEIGKIVSLAFRLFGNLFAGGVALMAVTFLVALMVPGVIYLLEVIIGTVQALVFPVLTLVFAVQAMEAHHGDDEHHEHH